MSARRDSGRQLQLLKCFICVCNDKLTRQALGGRPATLPHVRPAVTLYEGTAVCAEHIEIAPPKAGAKARAAGLLLPGG